VKEWRLDAALGQIGREMTKRQAADQEILAALQHSPQLLSYLAESR
jgi:hypothetical protein